MVKLISSERRELRFGKKRAVMGVVLVVLLTGSFILVNNYRNFIESVANSGGSAPFSLAILNPIPGSSFEIGDQIVLQVIASGPSPVKIMELYVNEALVESQATPIPGGVLNFQVNFYWYAREIGNHNLYVRAISGDGLAKSSALLPLEVVEIGTFDPQDIGNAYVDIGQSVPLNLLSSSPDGAPRYNPVQQGGPELLPELNKLTRPADLDQAGDSQPWEPSIFSWIAGLFAPIQSVPAAPGIPTSAIESCRPRLWISNNSDNEAGFHVYRRDPGLADFFKIATLASYEGPVFTFNENADKYGIYQYYVSAFSNAGEAPSEIKTVLVDSPNCEPSGDPVMRLDLATLFTDYPTEMGYCYASFGGSNWLRFPQNPQTFFDTSAENAKLQSQLIISSVEGKSISGGAVCWAWQADGLNFVGSWHSDDVKKFNPDFAEIIAYDDFSRSQIQWSDLHLVKLAYDLRVPVPQAFLGSGPQVCADHVGQNPFFILVCADIADDLDYVYWNTVECPADTCFKDSDIIGYNIYYPNWWSAELPLPVETKEVPVSLHFMINGTSCHSRDVQITTLVEYKGQILESFPSNSVHYDGNSNCPFLFREEPHTYRVTLDTIDFSIGNIDDGIDLDDDLEAFGYLSIWNPRNNSYSWSLAIWPAIQIFTDEAEDNPVSWSEINLWRCDNSSPCVTGREGLTAQMLKLEGVTVEKGIGNHTAEIQLYRGDWASLFTTLRDNDGDDLFGSDYPYHSDEICRPEIFYFDTYAVDNAPNQTLHVTQRAYHPDAACEFKWFVELLD